MTYDPEADALYVSFEPRREGDVVSTVELGDERQADYGSDGILLGIEFLGVSRGLNLDGVPRGPEVRAALTSLPRLAASA